MLARIENIIALDHAVDALLYPDADIVGMQDSYSLAPKVRNIVEAYPAGIRSRRAVHGKVLYTHIRCGLDRPGLWRLSG